MDPSEYKPQPVDTSTIELDAGLRANVEALARNNHEVWARARTAEGWKYGPERNDARKEHPGLVPYEQLSEAEKEIDRGTVLQTLKAAAVLGFDIRRDGAAPTTVCDEAEVSEDDIARWPPWPPGISGQVISALDRVQEKITQIYQCSDEAAGTSLLWHRVIAVLVALLGMGAVIVAICELYLDLKIAVWVEVLLAFLALVAVIVGLRGVFMKKWLEQRHRAERCRFLKFDCLLEVAVAGRDPNQLLRIANKFDELADGIRRVKEDGMERWLGKEAVLQKPPAASHSAVVSEDVRSLAENYRRTRLEVQSQYFFKQAGKNLRWNWQSRQYPAILFAFSIFFAFAHFVLHWWSNLDAVGRAFTLLAAGFPVIGAAVRALRGISEFSRNNLRFSAKYHALEDLIGELEREMAGNPKAQDIVLLLWKSEQVLEGEHREWLRLMMETEWIG